MPVLIQLRSRQITQQETLRLFVVVRTIMLPLFPYTFKEIALLPMVRHNLVV